MCVDRILIIAILVIMAVVGNGDYEDAKREEVFYCHMVAAGHWPDYKETFALCAPPDLLDSAQGAKTEKAAQQGN